MRADLLADCGRCSGLCCVALPFARSADFPVDKDGGEPCTHLRADFGCGVHERLRPLGYAGCTVFECAGAGQKVTGHTFGGRTWREEPALREQVFAVFPVVRALHELIRLIEQARALRPSAELDRALAETQRLSDAGPTELLGLDVDGHRAAVNPVLLAVSVHVRGPEGADHRGADLVGARWARADLRAASLRGARLVAADLRGARLERADLTGADLRAAELAGADLAGALFLGQAQLDAARGDAATTVPADLHRPPHWSPEVLPVPAAAPGRRRRRR